MKQAPYEIEQLARQALGLRLGKMRPAVDKAPLTVIGGALPDCYLAKLELPDCPPTYWSLLDLVPGMTLDLAWLGGNRVHELGPEAEVHFRPEMLD